MNISAITQKMIAFSEGNLHDIEHFLKVWAYARTIGRQEGLEAPLQEILEAAALVHDIACPLCREKYGRAEGHLQEQEGGPLARDFLRDTGLSPEAIDRVAFLVARHHTPEEADGPDYQILLEADYLVNAHESGYSPAHIRRTLSTLFRTPTGIALLKTMYLPE